MEKGDKRARYGNDQGDAIIIAVLRGIGRGTLAFLAVIGHFTLFTVTALSHCVRPPFYFRLLLRQMIDIGYYSLPVVGLTALFTGMVLALQSYTGFARFNAENQIALVVALSMTRELGPVLASLMVVGRVGAAMAAELGTMRVTEQIDALTTLRTDPFKYLVVPRLIAGIITLPILVLIADIIGIMGGWLIAVYQLNFNGATYLRSVIDGLQQIDVLSGLIKATVFGFIIALMGCYQGFHSSRGALGVGRATTTAVVTASVAILLVDYILTAVLFTR